MKETRAILRTIAWERAKGELNAMLTTFYTNLGDDPEQFEKLYDKVNAFVEEVENNALQE